MLCPYCYGKGYVYLKEITDGELNDEDYIKAMCKPQPTCEECQGTGTVHCCDGLIENDQT